jgi:hypothetical protein
LIEVSKTATGKRLMAVGLDSIAATLPFACQSDP